MKRIRNFCIIAHIDHGKSTLADRFLEVTKTVEKRKMKAQLLDQMELEQERGITIKLQPVRMEHKNYILNLIDTPGHVDFSYEVSRSLAAVEGAILLVDAVQGIQAQTLANYYLAREQGLAIIPVLNKIDLPGTRIDEIIKELCDLLKCQPKDILKVSAKTGEGVEELLDKIIERVPAPGNFQRDPSLRSGQGLKALIFDSVYDDYRGVVAYVRVMSGEVKKDDKILLMGNGKQSEVVEVGHFKPNLVKTESLQENEIGYVVTGLKDLAACRVGDTLTLANQPADKALAGYQESKPMVFAGIFCKEGIEPRELREGLEKIKLTDAALSFEPENSPALGMGFRCGFLGLLHLEIIQERLKREHKLEIIVTAPSVAYKIKKKNNQEFVIHSPQELPKSTEIEKVFEPWVKLDILALEKYLGNIMSLVTEKRGIYQTTEYLSSERIVLHYEMPLSGMLTDFYDKLKSVTSGYASLNYEVKDYRECEVERLDVLIAEEKVDSLASIVYKNEAYAVARKIVKALKEVLPRQMFEVKIQAVLNYDERNKKSPSTKLRAGQGPGGKIIAAERISAMRKDVTAKLYGGDVTRKRKLLEKQKKGKKKMKAIGHGKVDIPTEAYLAVLKR